MNTAYLKKLTFPQPNYKRKNKNNLGDKHVAAQCDKPLIECKRCHKLGHTAHCSWQCATKSKYKQNTQVTTSINNIYQSRPH